MRKTIEDFYRAEYRNKVGLMTARCGGNRADGEDVVQEAFARAVRFSSTYNPELGPFDVWFNTILYNSLRDSKRAARGGVEVPTDGLSVGDLFEDTEKAAFFSKRQAIILEVGKISNEKHRDILLLFFEHGYTSREIEQFHPDCTQSSVTTIVNRFRKKILVS